MKFTEYSQEIGVLDFFESLTSIPKAIAAMTQVFDQMAAEGKPGSHLGLIAMETAFHQRCYVEFKKAVAYAEEDLIEYIGS